MWSDLLIFLVYGLCTAIGIGVGIHAMVTSIIKKWWFMIGFDVEIILLWIVPYIKYLILR